MSLYQKTWRVTWCDLMTLITLPSVWSNARNSCSSEFLSSLKVPKDDPSQQSCDSKLVENSVDENQSESQTEKRFELMLSR